MLNIKLTNKKNMKYLVIFIILLGLYFFGIFYPDNFIEQWVEGFICRKENVKIDFSPFTIEDAYKVINMQKKEDAIECVKESDGKGNDRVLLKSPPDKS